MSLFIVLLLQACTLTSKDSSVVMITGADSDTGYALAEEYAGQGWRVIATCRDSEQATMLRSLADRYDNVTIETLDVRDHQQIDALAGKYAETAIDVLINNEELRPGRESNEVGEIDFDTFDLYTGINVTAPLKITESFIEHVAASEHKIIVTITSVDSSLTNVDEPGDYFYRASKAAMNIVMVTMAPDLSQRGIAVGLVAPLAPTGSAAEVLASQAGEMFVTINGFSATTSASFKGSDGQPLAW